MTKHRMETEKKLLQICEFVHFFCFFSRLSVYIFKLRSVLQIQNNAQCRNVTDFNL